MNKAHYLHKEFPKTCDETDFWGQVKRTIQGQPVDESQIQMIVDKVSAQLQLQPAHRLLDLGCGNGALSDRLFAQCAGGLGIDFSEHLIGIAHKYFERLPDRRYRLGEVLSYVREAPEAEAQGFDRAMAYGVFAYLPSETIAEVLGQLNQRFSRLERIFIGNMPDRARLAAFLGDRPYTPGFESDPESPLGFWREQQEFAALARDAGWHCELSLMPTQYHAAHYRFDALLHRG